MISEVGAKTVLFIKSGHTQIEGTTCTSLKFGQLYSSVEEEIWQETEHTLRIQGIKQQGKL